ncbi:hypothetical protein [Pseudomonas sp. BMS12]|uniref:hypothetical protein n=1 Tax=Pseudomonas sp. BMS12 TaxID=1796033 RepID=UPI00083A5CD1|nr:hypothetical protein [Pseudomonas sp. BMS12]
MCARHPAWLAMLLAVTVPVLAENAQPPQMNASIDDTVKSYRGNLMINQAAGDQHQQINARAISAGDHGSASTSLVQGHGASSGAAIDARARILGASFTNGSGVAGINQSAGVGNQQINAFRLATDAAPESLDDSVLQQNAAPATLSGMGVPGSGERMVELDDRAFAGSRGVVQLNQSAGIGNRTANNLSIRVTE